MKPSIGIPQLRSPFPNADQERKVMLTGTPKPLGRRGRDAARPAARAAGSGRPAAAFDRADVRFMIDPGQRAAAAALIGLA
jgi:hypothetical protein